MSGSELADGVGNESSPADTEPDLRQDPDGGRDDIPAPESATGRQPTGDEAVDDVLAQLDDVAGQPLDTQIEVGEQVHRVLQGRLADLGKE